MKFGLMIKSVGFLIILATSCSHKVTRKQWLACCKMCEQPVNMDHIEIQLFEDFIHCHCVEGWRYTIRVAP